MIPLLFDLLLVCEEAALGRRLDDSGDWTTDFVGMGVTLSGLEVNWPIEADRRREVGFDVERLDEIEEIELEGLCRERRGGCNCSSFLCMVDV